jgi:hypothetical protein
MILLPASSSRMNDFVDRGSNSTDNETVNPSKEYVPNTIRSPSCSKLHSFQTTFVRDVNVAAREHAVKDMSNKTSERTGYSKTSDEMAACRLPESEWMVVQINLWMRECRRSVNEVSDKVRESLAQGPCHAWMPLPPRP